MSQDMLPIGHVLADTYCITKLLGKGGMACVYEVTHVRLPMRSAVKLITGSISTDPKFLQRFRQEAEILARLRHPHVVHVSDFNQTEDGHPYLVMELLEGEDLAQRLSRTGPMSLAEALPIFLQIGDALQAAHDQGIIHRDLKPANVFLLSNGAFPNYAKVLDFGIAKSIDACSALRTKNAEFLGTPAYMAPEQARGTPNAASVRSDQFSLALVLYEMLAGRAAFYVPGEDLMQTLTRVLFDVPEPLPYPQIEPAMRRALNKNPNARFDSIRGFIAATGALELSVIKPLLAYTRPLPSVVMASSPPQDDPAVAEPAPAPNPTKPGSPARWSTQPEKIDNEQSTLKPRLVAARAPGEAEPSPLGTGAPTLSTPAKIISDEPPDAKPADHHRPESCRSEAIAPVAPAGGAPRISAAGGERVDAAVLDRVSLSAIAHFGCKSGCRQSLCCTFSQFAAYRVKDTQGI